MPEENIEPIKPQPPKDPVEKTELGRFYIDKPDDLGTQYEASKHLRTAIARFNKAIDREQEEALSNSGMIKIDTLPSVQQSALRYLVWKTDSELDKLANDSKSDEYIASRLEAIIEVLEGRGSILEGGGTAIKLAIEAALRRKDSDDKSRSVEEKNKARREEERRKKEESFRELNKQLKENSEKGSEAEDDGGGANVFDSAKQVAQTAQNSFTQAFDFLGGAFASAREYWGSEDQEQNARLASLPMRPSEDFDSGEFELPVHNGLLDRATIKDSVYFALEDGSRPLTPLEQVPLLKLQVTNLITELSEMYPERIIFSETYRTKEAFDHLVSIGANPNKHSPHHGGYAFDISQNSNIRLEEVRDYILREHGQDFKAYIHRGSVRHLHVAMIGLDGNEISVKPQSEAASRAELARIIRHEQLEKYFRDNSIARVSRDKAAGTRNTSSGYSSETAPNR